ncbi:MAG: hypothetical protein ACMUEL_08655 [Flavobacteriales bacterium Tduv]
MGTRTYFWQYKTLVWIRKGVPYKGLTRVHAQYRMEAMDHNLYRSPVIIMCSL